MKPYKVKPIPLVAIIGPTASGKTDLAIKLAKKFNGFIISADSRQIYQGLPIGTNQPAGKWRMAHGKWKKSFGEKKLYFVNNIPHFFIANKKPNQRYSVVQYQKEVNLFLNKLSTTSYLPILVGGTGLYISSIIEGYVFPKAQPNLKLRNKLNKLSDLSLLQQLKKLDSKTYNLIDKKNHRRIIRALEFVLSTKQSFFNAQQKNPRLNSLIIGLNLPRAKIYSQINQRVDQMIKKGLINEVKWLLKKYPHSPALKTIGYQELVPVIKKGTDLRQAIELIKQHTRNFAKRQLTWFKRMPNISWIRNYKQAQAKVERFLNR
ncbi:MAG: tRNA (adenosine(37)-N6)-dimethylallyltransferase MiaA [Patescibacteria group bacterium]